MLMWLFGKTRGTWVEMHTAVSLNVCAEKKADRNLEETCANVAENRKPSGDVWFPSNQ